MKVYWQTYIAAAILGLTLNLMMHFATLGEFFYTALVFIGYQFHVLFAYFMSVNNIDFFIKYCDFCETIIDYAESIHKNYLLRN